MLCNIIQRAVQVSELLNETQAANLREREGSNLEVLGAAGFIMVGRAVALGKQRQLRAAGHIPEDQESREMGGEGI